MRAALRHGAGPSHRGVTRPMSTPTSPVSAGKGRPADVSPVVRQGLREALSGLRSFGDATPLRGATSQPGLKAAITLLPSAANLMRSPRAASPTASESASPGQRYGGPRVAPTQRTQTNGSISVPFTQPMSIPADSSNLQTRPSSVSGLTLLHGLPSPGDLHLAADARSGLVSDEEWALGLSELRGTPGRLPILI